MKSLLLGGVFGALVCIAPVYAMKLSPEGTKIEYMDAKKYNRSLLDLFMKAAAFELFTGPVHEEITQRIFGCEADIADQHSCSDLELEYAGVFPIIGVRWNDDPPFRLDKRVAERIGCDSRYTIRFATQPKCWVNMFKLAEKRAGRGRTFGPKNANLMFRSHFGDLQFMHAMAGADGEPASATRGRILMWAEFTWKVATGEIRLAQLLRDLRAPDMREHFAESGWSVQDLLTLGLPTLRTHIREVAFGALLHAVQDSFAAGHVERAAPVADARCKDLPDLRAPGRIREFHAYGKQHHGRHADADSRDALVGHIQRYRNAHGDSAGKDEQVPHVISIGRTLVGMLFERQLKWAEVKPYMECVFDLEDPDRASSPGPEFLPQ